MGLKDKFAMTPEETLQAVATMRSLNAALAGLSPEMQFATVQSVLARVISRMSAADQELAFATLSVSMPLSVQIYNAVPKLN